MVDRRKPQLDELLEKGSENLAGDVQDVEGLDPSQYEKKQLALKHGQAKHWSECIMPLLNWAFFILIILAIVAVILMVGFWLWGNLNNPGKLEDAFKFFWGLLITAGSTLFVESLVVGRR